MNSIPQSPAAIDSADPTADLGDEPLDRRLDDMLYPCDLDVPADLST